MPLRPGCLEILDSLYDGDEYLSKSVTAIDQIISIFALQKPTLMAITSGVFVGLEYARMHGEKIRKLVMTSSSHFGAIKNNSRKKMLRGFMTLKPLNQMIIKKLADFYAYKMRDPETTLRMLLSIHEGSEYDQYI